MTRVGSQRHKKNIYISIVPCRYVLNYIHQLECYSDDFHASYHAQVAMRSVYNRG